MKSFSLFCKVIFFLVLFSNFCHSQNASKTIDEYLTSMNKTGKFNGSILVAVNDSIKFNKGYGYAEFEHSMLNTPDSKFNIGSIAKQFTTVMIFQLEQEGKLKTGDFISKYLQNYRKDIGNKVTVDQLLRHTSGIPCYIRDYKRKPEDNLLFPFPGGTRFTKEELITKYMSGDILFEPGKQYHYSNTGFYFLYLIIEKVTGKTYEENLRERILVPLNLKNTGLLDNIKTVSNLTTGQIITPVGMIKAKYLYEPNYYGSGGIYSTTEDLLIWYNALHSGNFLSSEIKEKMFTPYMKEGGYVQYAYSLNYFTMRLPGETAPVKYTSFNGAIQGFISDVINFTDGGITVVILDNSDQMNHTSIAGNIFRIIKNQKVTFPKPALSSYISKTAIEKGVDNAVSEYYKIIDENSDEYEVSSLSGLSWTAFIFADAGMNNKAITLLKLNIILHPNSAEAYNDFADFLEHIKSPDAGKMREKAGNIKHREKELYGLISGLKFDEAIKIVESAKKEFPRPDVFESYKIGPIFGELMGNGKMHEAIQVCKIWAKGNTGDVGPYFSMARVYEILNSTTEQIKCYKKILELAKNESQIQRAKDKLKELEK